VLGRLDATEFDNRGIDALGATGLVEADGSLVFGEHAEFVCLGATRPEALLDARQEGGSDSLPPAVGIGVDPIESPAVPIGTRTSVGQPRESAVPGDTEHLIIGGHGLPEPVEGVPVVEDVGHASGPRKSSEAACHASAASSRIARASACSAASTRTSPITPSGSRAIK